MSKHNQFPIPPRYRGAEAVAACKSKACEQAKSFLSRWDMRSGGALLGPTRCGKSVVAGLSGDRAAAKLGEGSQTWTKWIRADYLTRMIHERSGGEMVNELKLARVLIIDEMGYERFPELCLEVIGDRHDNQRPVIITSGMRVKEFAARYSDATLARIAEIGNGIIVDCWGDK
jgi:DNA replication protein DnaC